MLDIYLPQQPDKIQYMPSTGRIVATVEIYLSTHTSIVLAFPSYEGRQCEHGYLEFATSYESYRH